MSNMVIHDEAGTSPRVRRQLHALFEHSLVRLFRGTGDLPMPPSSRLLATSTAGRLRDSPSSVRVRSVSRGPGQQSGMAYSRQSASTPTKEKVLTLNRPRAVSFEFRKTEAGP